jgi:hypothetical protein
MKATKKTQQTKQAKLEDLSPNQPKAIKGGLSLNYAKITYN